MVVLVILACSNKLGGVVGIDALGLDTTKELLECTVSINGMTAKQWKAIKILRETFRNNKAITLTS